MIRRSLVAKASFAGGRTGPLATLAMVTLSNDDYRGKLKTTA